MELYMVDVFNGWSEVKKNCDITSYYVQSKYADRVRNVLGNLTVDQLEEECNTLKVIKPWLFDYINNKEFDPEDVLEFANRHKDEYPALSAIYNMNNVGITFNYGDIFYPVVHAKWFEDKYLNN